MTQQTDPAETKMEACPFVSCGSTPHMMRNEYGDGHAPTYYVECACGARGPLAATADYAWTEWNTRRSTPSPSDSGEGGEEG